MIRTVGVVTSILALASAECPNGCSSHGRCTAYDMCLCYRNWMSNDCSERVCQFGLAHVDTPKGDLDASSGELDGTDIIVALNSEMYPYGTTEQFPAMMAGDDYLDNTAHYYMECSNKGICDREAGTCECFPGYEGSACQRASCPSTGGQTCSGHGTCETIKQIAAADNGNIYELWDEKATMGCVCDAGYYGADCALRECKYGADPLYFDDNANIRYSNWTVVLAARNGETALEGTYSITFYDHFGEDWETGPLAHDSTCADLITALEDIPNDVIPDNSVRCYKFDVVNDEAYDYWDSSVEPNLAVLHRYTLMFPENPGYLKEIRLNKYLDGARPTLTTAGADNDLMMWVFADGFHGEDNDMVPDECEDVLVSFRRSAGFPVVGDLNDYFYLSFPDPDVQIPLLKRCLGDADNDQSFSSTADEVYDWDYGSDQNPHLVKFIEDANVVVSRVCHSINDFARVDATHNEGWCYDDAPAGFYAPVIFGQAAADADKEFIVYSNAPADYDYDTLFRVFTTTGYLNRVNEWAEVFTKTDDFTDLHSNVLYTYQRGDVANAAIHGGSTSDYRTITEWSGNVDCETYQVSDITTEDCLQKGDRVMFFTTESTDVNYATNPRYHNMFTVQKIYKAYPLVDTPHDTEEEKFRNRIVLDMHVNFRAELSATSHTLNGGDDAKDNDQRLRAYKFYPPAAVVNYVDECSGRGICNTESGICDCFVGYTKDDCSIQSTGAR